MTERSDRAALGQLLADVIHEKRLTQKTLADRSGLRRELIGRIVRGESRAAITDVMKLVDALEIPLGQFFARLEERRDAAAEDEPPVETEPSPPSPDGSRPDSVRREDTDDEKQ